MRNSNQWPNIFQVWEEVVETLDPSSGYEQRHSVIEGDKDWTVEIDMPGVKKEDVEISLDRGILKVSGERKTASERTYVKSFTAPQGVTEKNISASYADGVLTLTVTKAEKDKKRNIKVS